MLDVNDTLNPVYTQDGENDFVLKLLVIIAANGNQNVMENNHVPNV